MADDQQMTHADERDARRYRLLRAKLMTGNACDVGEAYIVMEAVGSWPTREEFDAATDRLDDQWEIRQSADEAQLRESPAATEAKS